mgnify:CR=1 FL=1
MIGDKAWLEVAQYENGVVLQIESEEKLAFCFYIEAKNLKCQDSLSHFEIGPN